VLKGSKITELPDGKLAALGNGKTVKISPDHGTTWNTVVEPTPVQPNGLLYAPARQSFFIWQSDCKDQVLTNAVWRHEYRLEAKQQ
jgi:hypothetical protein